MKRIFILLLCCTFIKVSAQDVNHYFNYPLRVASNHFKKDKTKIGLGRYNWYIGNSFNYRIEVKKLGFEFFYSNTLQFYNQTEYDYRPLNDIVLRKTTTRHFGIALHYKILQNKYISVSPYIGLTKNKHDETYMAYWYQRFSEKYTFGLMGHEFERNTGVLAGMNLHVNVYKNLYAQSNLRYIYMPYGELNKQNLIWELGIGVRLSHTLKE